MLTDTVIMNNWREHFEDMYINPSAIKPRSGGKVENKELAMEHSNEIRTEEVEEVIRRLKRGIQQDTTI